MAIAIAITIFLSITAIITLFGYRRYVLAGRLYENIRSGTLTEISSSDPAAHSIFYSVIQFVEKIGRKPPPSPQKASTVQRDLLAAGYRAQNAAAVFEGLKIILAAAMAVLALLWHSSLPFSGAGRVMAIMVAILGAYRLPGFVLARRIKRRHHQLRKALPDALDLMVVCAEAGVAIDRSFRNVTHQLGTVHPNLSVEFGLVTAEITAGIRRKEAFENLGERCQEPELRKFCNVLIQADRFGTSLGDALRTHADYLRVRRRQEAEERAGKVGVKLIFPIFFFILPCMFLVTVGPAAMQIVKRLGPALRGSL